MGAAVGVEPTTDAREAAESADTFNGCWGLVRGRGPGFGGGRCFNILWQFRLVSHFRGLLPSGFL